MNMDKRYCQNRQRKRKRTIAPSPIENKNVSPSEEERQFKLRRFVEDVGKFLSEKESCSDQKILPKTKTSTKEKRTVKKVTIPNPMVKRGFQRSGMQTKVCRRGGVLNREMTARLDENMHQIISLGNHCNHQCQCAHPCKGKFDQQTSLGSLENGMEPRTTSILRPLQPRSSPSCQDLHPSPSPSVGLVGGEGVATSSGGTKNGKSLSELDKELYPLFARVVIVSLTQTKSALFKNRSYVSAVKRNLLQLYVNRVSEDRRYQLSYLQESKKATSSVGTSPYPSPVPIQSSQHNIESPFKLAPAKFHFQSTMQFLEETIGPSSSCSSKQMVPSPQHCQSLSRHSQPPVQHGQPHLPHRQPTTSLLSPPVMGYHRPQRVSSYVSKASKYVHEPFPPSSPAITPLHNYKAKVFDGSGDGFHFNCFNSFLPPIEEEEDSPDFRYYPRKIF